MKSYECHSNLLAIVSKIKPETLFNTLESSLAFKNFQSILSCMERQHCLMSTSFSICGAFCIICGALYIICTAFLIICGVFVVICGTFVIICSAFVIICGALFVILIQGSFVVICGAFFIMR